MQFASLAHSPGSVAAPDKSPVQKWINRLAGIHRNAPAHVQHGAHAIRQYAEGGLVGGAFGALDATKPQYSDKAQLSTAAVGFAGAIIGATEDYATDLRNIGSNAFAIFTFRKGREMVEKKRLAAHGESGASGEFGGSEDPVVIAARDL